MKYSLLIIVTMSIFFLFACKKENINDSPILKSNEYENYSDEMLELGAQIEDPYKLSNMQMAFANLVAIGEAPPFNEVIPTNKYIRILPQNEDELNILKEDTNLLLWDYPLDYEIIVQGIYYHDPSISESSITWQYCVVPIDYQIPVGIYYELIYEVYIPPMEEIELETEENLYDEYSNFYGKLLYEAYRITGNIEDDSSDTIEKKLRQKAKKKNKLWLPYGRIKVYDHLVNGYINLVYAKVQARYCTHIQRGYTNDSGIFIVDGGFLYNVNYSIKWETGCYDIRNGGVQAWYNGPKKRDVWILNIGTGGKSIMLATVHRAAYKFFYADNLGIRRPNLSYGKTKIAYRHADRWWGLGCCWGTWSFLGALPDIIVCGLDGNANRSTYEIFSTTIHELGHQSHLLFMGLLTYTQLAMELHESWAQAIEWALTNDEYNNKLAKNIKCIDYNHDYGGGQLWTNKTDEKGHSKPYTPLFVDLIDDINQRNGGNLGYINHYSTYTFTGNFDYPNDMISGYSLQYIQNHILIDSYGLTSLRTAIKNNKIPGVTDAIVDSLMAKYWGLNFGR